MIFKKKTWEKTRRCVEKKILTAEIIDQRLYKLVRTRKEGASSTNELLGVTYLAIPPQGFGENTYLNEKYVT